VNFFKAFELVGIPPKVERIWGPKLKKFPVNSLLAGNLGEKGSQETAPTAKLIPLLSLSRLSSGNGLIPARFPGIPAK
jgi:hypothetical protein